MHITNHASRLVCRNDPNINCSFLWNVFITCFISSLLILVPRPTFGELICMKKRDGSSKDLRIIDWITTHNRAKCEDFANKLLNDRLSVRKLNKKYENDDELFVRAVLDKWLGRDDDDEKGSLSCTWETLVKCVEESGLDEEFLKLLRENVPRPMQR